MLKTSKIYDILDLLRLNKISRHAGYMLVFLPCAMGVGLYANLEHDYKKIILFFFGAIIMRGAGCIINDILDRKIDILVERTKNRPVADGRIKIPEAIVIFSILSLIGLLILLQFSWHAIIFGFIGMFLLLTYPLAKRFTFFPQIYLGLTFNIGIFIAVADALDQITIPSIILYVGCIFWTIYYDTIYAFADIDDDKKADIKSLARVLEKRNYRIWLGFFGIIANILICFSFYITGHAIAIYFIVNSFLIIRQVITINIYDTEYSFMQFVLNVYIGTIWAAAALIPYHP